MDVTEEQGTESNLVAYRTRKVEACRAFLLRAFDSVTDAGILSASLSVPGLNLPDFMVKPLLSKARGIIAHLDERSADMIEGAALDLLQAIGWECK